MARHEQTPDNPFATLTLAEIYLDQGLWENALDAARKALESDPGNRHASAMVSFLENLVQRGRSKTKTRTGTEPSFESGVRLYTNSSLHGSFEWIMNEQTLLASKKRAGLGSRMVVRIFWVSSGKRGPRRRTKDYFVEGHQGSVELGPIPPERNYGAAIGWLSPAGAFVAAAHTTME